MQYDKKIVLKALRSGAKAAITRHDTIKSTIDITPAHKWFIEEIAHAQRTTQRQVIYDLIQGYHDSLREYKVLPYKELEESEYDE